MSDRFFENSASKSSGSTLERTSNQAQIDIPTLLMQDQIHQKARFDKSSTTARAYLNLGESVAHIKTLDATRSDGTNSTLGSGFFVRSDGVLATDYHVIQNAKYGIVITTSDGVEHQARIRDIDTAHDLALLQVLPNMAGEKFKPAVLADSSSEMRAGQAATVLGFPSDTPELHVSPGKAKPASQLKAHAGENFKYLDGESPDRKVLETDMLVQGGVSGGPLVAANGRVVGVEDLGVPQRALTISTPIEDLHNLLRQSGVQPDGVDGGVSQPQQAIAADQTPQLDNSGRQSQTNGSAADTAYNPFAHGFVYRQRSDSSVPVRQQDATVQQEVPVLATRAVMQPAPRNNDSALDFFANLKTIPWGN